MIRLGVNVDHVATVRQARLTYEPDPVFAAYLAELGGADQITVHLREDRRHIQERDLRILRQTVTTRLNLEMAADEKILEIALDVKPEQATLVPERRQEVTTEGGLDVKRMMKRLSSVIQRLQDKEIFVSLFIAPEEEAVRASARVGADGVEFHTGEYANTRGDSERISQLERLRKACELGHSLGLHIAAGHGLTYTNIHPIKNLPYLEEVNIGHSIIARAIYVGIEEAVRQMKELLK
ncbi:MAG: pyridoxine 5'-phosphate synthase [Planctomycetota bacterium]|nr:pyridoxine 5'-phosphate synthase [Planctomycetota bacterium]